MHRVTASQLDRLMHCTGSSWLTNVRSSSHAATKGTWRHRFLEVWAREGKDAALEAVPEEYRALCAAIPLDELPMLSAEMAFAYDVETCAVRCLGQGLDRGYPDTAEWFGTADVVGLSPGVAYCADWKSRGNKTKAKDSWQLRFLGLCAAKFLKTDSAVIERISLGDDGEVFRSKHTMDVIELASVEHELKQLRNRLAGERVVHEGPWCEDYCPSYQACPAKTALAVRLARGSIIDSEGVTELTPAIAGEAWVRLKEARKLLDRVEKVCKQTLKNNGELPLPNGKVLKEVVEPGNDEIVLAVAEPYLAEKYGTAFAADVIQKSITKTRLKEVLKLAGHPVAKAEAQIVAELKVIGGIENPSKIKIVEVDK